MEDDPSPMQRPMRIDIFGGAQTLGNAIMGTHEAFQSVLMGEPIKMANWFVLRNNAGQTLLHVAAKYGRNYTALKLLTACPLLATITDYNLDLPEDLAVTEYIKEQCLTIRTVITVGRRRKKSAGTPPPHVELL